jgi:MinD-like ATPase involved in chromosome partitioning or flagellar assembly
VYTSGQLADLTGLPVVASIPSLPGLTRTKAVESLSKPGGRVLESFRNMAYTYLASGAGGGQTVMFTGIGAAGSSSVGAAQFAVALAQAGSTVILVDAERTRQVVTNGFNATDKRGVSNALHEGSDASTMLVDTIYENLRVLPIGTVPEALVSNAAPERVEAMLSTLRQKAQIVVVSVAPADILADAAAFASRVDEVCLNVSARTNEYSTVPMAYDILDKAGAKSIKLILTDTAKEGEPFTSATSINRAV